MDRRLVPILVLLLLGSTALTLAAHAFGVFPFDMELALRLRGVENPIFATAMAAVSLPGDGWIPFLLVLAAAAILAARKLWTEAVFVIATLSTVLLAGVLKVLVGRQRPPYPAMNLSHVFPSINHYSYPSGHVLFYVVFFGFLAWLSWRHLSGMARWIALSACAALIMLIGPSRLLVGDHWVSDVIGSYIIGTLWLIILILLYEMVLEWRARAVVGSNGRRRGEE